MVFVEPRGHAFFLRLGDHVLLSAKWRLQVEEKRGPGRLSSPVGVRAGCALENQFLRAGPGPGRRRELPCGGVLDAFLLAPLENLRR